MSQEALVRVLIDTRTVLDQPGNDFFWSRWKDRAAAVADIDDILRRIEAAETIKLESLELLYAPTGPLQEVSIDGDWADEFMTLSRRFEQAIADL